jgi:hypothetical protein
MFDVGMRTLSWVLALVLPQHVDLPGSYLIFLDRVVASGKVRSHVGDERLCDLGR